MELTDKQMESDVHSLQKESLLKKVEELCFRFGWKDAEGKPRVPAMLAVLSSRICEREIQFLLSNTVDDRPWKQFDAYYKQKSDYATLVIIDCLKTKLQQHGFSASIATETRDSFGTYDITIGNPCRLMFNGSELAKIEVKASFSMPFEQLGRYALDSSPLIICRVITGQVAILRPAGELRNFISFLVEIVTQKAERIIQEKFYTIRGKYCNYCFDYGCPHNLNRSRLPGNENKQFSLVTVPPRQFNWDIQTFLQNLRFVSERTAELVLEEIRLRKKSAGVEN